MLPGVPAPTSLCKGNDCAACGIIHFLPILRPQRALLASIADSDHRANRTLQRAIASSAHGQRDAVSAIVNRIVVVYGSGHAYLLHQFARESGVFRFMDVSDVIHAR